MAALSTDSDEGDYWIKDDIQKSFFKNSQFCLCLQDYLSNSFSVQIEISLETPPKKNRWYNESMAYRIRLIGAYVDKPKMQQTVSDFMKNFLQTIQTKTYNDDKGKLNCKHILFSNWLPNSLINNDNILRRSIQLFISKSIEYIIKQTDILSIAFAVPDSCTNEIILAEEMITEVKRQLETEKFQLKISFVFLPEQQTLYEQFSNIIQTMQDVYAYFDWPTTIIEITLIASTIEDITRCQEKINKYLSRCITSTKITHSNGIFQSWNQHTINSFYKYCKDRCILPKLNETQNEIELIGPANGILEVKKKLHILSELIKEKLIERSNSAVIHSSRTENKVMTKLYNIVISYNRKDIRKCQRLINRLTEEGFSVWIDEEQCNICSQMDKSDCIILCISENYYENLSCIEEAKYAFQTDKKIFLVKIQNKPLFGWDNDLFEGKLFFQSFGSDNYFEMEYERLLLELLRYTKPGFTSLLQRRSSYIQQNNDECQGIPRIKHNEIENLNNKSQNKTIDNDKYVGKSDNHLKTQTSTRQLTFIEERWLQKLTNIPKPNLSLFAVHRTGFNDAEAPVEMLADSYKISDFYIRSILPISRFFFHMAVHSSGVAIKTSIDEDQTYGKCTKKIQVFNGLSQVFPTEHPTVDFIPRRISKNDYYYSTARESTFFNEEEMKKRREFDDPEKMKHIREKLAKYFIEKYKHYTQEQMNIYLQFAQRMKDNTKEFETFCSTTTIMK